MPELDALRGLFLVWMTFTHMPTRFSDFVNQPFGFLSSAEWFGFMSALLLSRVYLRNAQRNESGLLEKLWRRTFKIYSYHLLMLAFAFTVAAAFAARTHRPALYNLLNFYLAHPVVAIIGSALLIYCPPLLDILPMYVIFLFFLEVRHGWLGPHLTQETLGMQVDKWQIGPLRLINLAACLVVCYWLRRYLVRLIAREPFLTLGKASLQVFCAHVFFVFAGLALLYGDIPQLQGFRAYGMLALTFTGLFRCARREVLILRPARLPPVKPA